jgi:DNA-binding transcriptional MerR regulator
MLYSIGEVAKMTGLNISTLRYYDKEGLFSAMGRNEGGIRVFTNREIVATRIIECLKSTGLSIKDIKQFMEWGQEGDATLQKRRDLYYERLEAVKQQLEQVQQSMRIIEFKCWYYDTALDKGTEDAVRNLSPDEVPEEMRNVYVPFCLSAKE